MDKLSKEVETVKVIQKAAKEEDLKERLRLIKEKLRVDERHGRLEDLHTVLHQVIDVIIEIIEKEEAHT